MFKKITAVLLAFVIVIYMATLALAVGPSSPVAMSGDPNTTTPTQKNVDFPGQTNFTDIGAWGYDTLGNPGYIVIKGCDGGDTACFPYYLWVRTDGKLMIASYPSVSAYSSWPSASWNNLNGFGAGTVVGQQ